MNRIIVSKETDPCYNLALEEELLRNVNDNQVILYLWRNDKTVVIGRNQNPFLECDIEKMNQQGVTLVRRISGGGAVYHDLGNLNFTFVSKESRSDVERQLKVIKAAVEKFGVKAEFSGRNDLICDGKKFSGHAFYNEDSNCFHHGTLMIDVDKSILGDLLKPSRIKLESKGITSVKSRVVNLKELCSDITTEALCDSLKESFEIEYGDCKGSAEYGKENWLPEQIDKYRDSNWTYGESPVYDAIFEKKTDSGNFQVLAKVEDGVIKSVKIYSDSLKTYNCEDIEKAIAGTYFHELDSLLEKLI